MMTVKEILKKWSARGQSTQRRMDSWTEALPSELAPRPGGHKCRYGMSNSHPSRGSCFSAQEVGIEKQGPWDRAQAAKRAKAKGT